MTKRELIQALEASSFSDDTEVFLVSMIDCEDLVPLAAIDEGHSHPAPEGQLPEGADPDTFPRKEMIILQTDFPCLTCFDNFRNGGGHDEENCDDEEGPSDFIGMNPTFLN